MRSVRSCRHPPDRCGVPLFLSVRRLAATIETRIALVGKYTITHGVSDTYLSVMRALKHAAVAVNRKLVVDWIDSERLVSRDSRSVAACVAVTVQRDTTCGAPRICARYHGESILTLQFRGSVGAVKLRLGCGCTVRTACMTPSGKSSSLPTAFWCLEDSASAASTARSCILVALCLPSFLSAVIETWSSSSPLPPGGACWLGKGGIHFWCQDNGCFLTCIVEPCVLFLLDWLCSVIWV